MKKYILDKHLMLRRLFLILLDIFLLNGATALALLSRFDFRLSQVELKYWEAVLDFFG